MKLDKSLSIVTGRYNSDNAVQIEKLEKNQFYCFHPCHVGMLCSKTLTLNCNT